MLYAIVDIETTGGYASASGITEIAIIITDGEKIVEQWESLINPYCAIPYFITRLTGITQAMVATAPGFEEVAPKIHALLSGKVFVAHNVNFDYSFVNHQLNQNGLPLNSKKLCTVRYGRKVIKGLRSYSLGNFCRSMDIPVENRHRAGGDCMATYYLLKKLFAADTQDALNKLLKNKTRERNLPLQLNKEDYHQLPSATGVYYFLNSKEKIIYIGKAVNIKKRVASHFSGNTTSKQRQEFIRNIAFIKFKIVATELMSLILESSEIKKYWPVYNKSQKHFEHQFGLFAYPDQNGYYRICVEKNKKNLPMILTVKNKVDGLLHLKKMVTEFSLCPNFCQVPYLSTETDPCICNGACSGKLSAKKYNKKVTLAVQQVKESTASFCIVDKGLNEEAQSVIAVSNGNFIGMGYIPKNITIDAISGIEQYLEKYKENQFINSVIFSKALEHPQTVITVK